MVNLCPTALSHVWIDGLTDSLDLLGPANIPSIELLFSEALRVRVRKNLSASEHAAEFLKNIAVGHNYTNLK